MFQTPRKGKSSINSKSCVTCGLSGKSPRKIANVANEQKGLSRLIRKYGGVNVVDGYVCRSCENKMFRWERDIAEQGEFYTVCQENLMYLKRGRNESDSPTKTDVKKRASCDGNVSDLQIFSDSRHILFESDHSYSSYSSCNTTKISGEQCIEQKCLLSTKSLVFKHSVTTVNDYAGESTNNNSMKNSTTPSNLRENESLISMGECLFAKLVANNITNAELEKLVKIMFSIECLSEAITTFLINQIKNEVTKLTSKQPDCMSILRSNKYSDLEHFSWFPIMNELTTKLPLLAGFMMALSSNVVNINLTDLTKNVPNEIIKRLCMAYVIMMQGRCKDLSLVQRVITVLLLDNICDSKVR